MNFLTGALTYLLVVFVIIPIFCKVAGLIRKMIDSDD